MKVDEKNLEVVQLLKWTVVFGVMGTFILIFGGAMKGLGTLMIATVILLWIYKYVIKRLADGFQNKVLVAFENWYEKRIAHAIRGYNVYWFFGVTFMMLIAAFMTFGMSVGSGRTKVEFFPDNTPNQIIVYIEYPEGTAINKTNQITKEIERRVYEIISEEEYLDADYNFLVESSVSQVGEGAGNPFTDGGSSAEMPHRGKITTSMREFKYRRGKDSEVLRGKIQEALSGIYPGVAISVEKDPVGPPAGYPINIELKGDDYDQLILAAETMRNFINGKSTRSK